MRTAAILSAVFLLVPLAANAGELRLDVALVAPVHTQSPFGDVLEVEGAQLFARPGEPLLPKRTFTFVLPQNTNHLE